MNASLNSNKHNTLSLAAASVLALTACAWGISGACKDLQQRLANHNETPTKIVSSR